MFTLLNMRTLKVFLLCVVIVASVAFLGRMARAEEALSPAAAALETELRELVPQYNEIAPKLKSNREALRALGYDFDDKTLKAVKVEVPLEQ